MGGPARPTRKDTLMDQDTFADLAANVARISAELEQVHRDIAQLAEAGLRIYRHLELRDESWENRREWRVWAETLGELRPRHTHPGRGVPPAHLNTGPRIVRLRIASQDDLPIAQLHLIGGAAQIVGDGLVLCVVHRIPLQRPQLRRIKRRTHAFPARVLDLASQCVVQLVHDQRRVRVRERRQDHLRLRDRVAPGNFGHGPGAGHGRSGRFADDDAPGLGRQVPARRRRFPLISQFGVPLRQDALDRRQRLPDVFAPPLGRVVDDRDRWRSGVTRRGRRRGHHRRPLPLPPLLPPPLPLSPSSLPVAHAARSPRPGRTGTCARHATHHTFHSRPTIRTSIVAPPQRGHVI